MMNIRSTILGLITLLMLSVGQAQAERALAVVELFTSQGCSSCPPADHVLGELAQERDIIALSYHVDYWDYMGWKDIFGSPENSQRQRVYAHRMKKKNVYTPQMVVNGKADVVGSRPMDVAKAVMNAKKRTMPVSVKITPVAQGLLVSAASNGLQNGTYDLIAVAITPNAEVQIKRGENRGKTIRYVNVVRDFKPIGQLSNGQARLTLPAVDGAKLAVFVQAQGQGPIVGADTSAVTAGSPSLVLTAPRSSISSRVVLAMRRDNPLGMNSLTSSMPFPFA
ncbi:MAG: DUF1223 domain-containing protein [Rhodobacteraceae bacterium]|nr:DUF1223 domain-containing protein [Paracoccaceae bacterium]